VTLGLFDPAFLGGLAAGGGGYDTDAQAYITAVEAADGQSLEAAVKDAINAFFVGCKSDGIFNAIKASCILAGARTLSGALVPLVGTAPTNYNFVAGDYNRETGLKGDGSTKYLDSNRNNNAEPQNSKHLAVYQNAARIASTGIYTSIGITSSTFTHDGASVILVAPSSLNNTLFCRANGLDNVQSQANGALAIGLQGVSRSNSSQLNVFADGTLTTSSSASQAPLTGNLYVFARNAVSQPADSYSDSRLSFYSIGESLDLALLDARVSTLMSDLAAAIP
jgi:hypothetical protein